ncbi:mitochondrial metalloendopeptidase OMA1-like [Bidens hawaiensis]|uniref:mitochondrial metalloendopeptidase OMA1-like n=1 Tax=Bidens hawaiensis TaxID=980011 RepID=UPI004049D0A2
MMSEISLPWTHTDPYDAKSVLGKVIDELNRELLKKVFVCRKLRVNLGVREVDGLSWDMFIGEDNHPIFSKVYLFAGKIVIDRVVVELIESEDDLDALIAHEVAHFIATHVEERLITNLTFALLRLAYDWSYKNH